MLKGNIFVACMNLGTITHSYFHFIQTTGSLSIGHHKGPLQPGDVYSGGELILFFSFVWPSLIIHNKNVMMYWGLYRHANLPHACRICWNLRWNLNTSDDWNFGSQLQLNRTTIKELSYNKIFQLSKNMKLQTAFLSNQCLL